MLITVLETTGDRVRFASAHGRARGTWAGGPPVVGRDYDVELDFDGPLTPAEVTARPDGTFRLDEAADRVRLEGLVEDAWEDGLALRLGPSIVMLEVEGPLPAPGSWLRIETARPLRVHDTNL